MYIVWRPLYFYHLIAMNWKFFERSINCYQNVWRSGWLARKFLRVKDLGPTAVTDAVSNLIAGTLSVISRIAIIRSDFDVCRARRRVLSDA